MSRARLAEGTRLGARLGSRLGSRLGARLGPRLRRSHHIACLYFVVLLLFGSHDSGIGRRLISHEERFVQDGAEKGS